MKPGSLDESLASLIEHAYEIIADKKLFAIEKKLPKSTEPGFEKVKNAFAKYIQYQGDGRIYSQWVEAAESALQKHGLQTSKFIAKCNMFDPQTESNTPAHQFIRGIKELEKIRDDKNYRNNYTKTTYTLPLTYTDGLLTNGVSDHRFQKKYRAVIKDLMPNRKIVDSSGKTTREPETITRSYLLQKHGLKTSDLHLLQRACSGVKGIDVKLSFPKKTNSVFLVTVEDAR